MPPKKGKTLSFDEIKKHTKEDDLWLIINNKVYDCSGFGDEHPGGVDTLLDVAGMDGTHEFHSVGHSDSAKDMLDKYYVGDVDPADLEAVAAAKKAAGGASGSSNMAIALVILLLGIVMYFVMKQ